MHETFYGLPSDDGRGSGTVRLLLIFFFCSLQHEEIVSRRRRQHKYISITDDYWLTNDYREKTLKSEQRHLDLDFGVSGVAKLIPVLYLTVLLLYSCASLALLGIKNT